MSEKEKKQQVPNSEQDDTNEKEEDPLGQDKESEVPTTNAITSQETAIEPIVKEDNNSTITTTARPTTDFHVTTQEEEDLTMKVRNAGDAFYYLVKSAIEKAKTISAQKVKELATGDIISPAAITTKKDAQDIASLGGPVEGLARTFENLMTEIRKQSYSEQVNLLTGYKKLLKEQINVIDSRISMTERLK
jgi:hypothetical protein